MTSQSPGKPVTTQSDRYLSDEYLAYMSSEKWKQKRVEVLQRALYQCERGCGEKATEVNHKTYSRLGYERLTDLEAVCHRCHIVADYERQEYGTSEQRRDKWEARVTGWATKVYGDWEGYHSFGEMEEEFEEWLYRRGEQ